jgi:hypothetical protein
MIASEHDNQNGAGRVVSELVSLSVDPGEFEIRRPRTERENRMGFLGPNSYNETQRKR